MANWLLRTTIRVAITAICLLAFKLSPMAAKAAGPVAPSWQVGYKATGLSYETQDPDGSISSRFNHFHVLSGNATSLAGGWLTVRGSARFAEVEPSLGRSTEPSKWYSGICEARLGTNTKALLGRQFVQAGVTSLTLDGVRMRHRFNRRWHLSAWAGARAPGDLAFDINGFDQDAAVGGRVTYQPSSRWRWGFSTAYRERNGQVAARPVGAELMTRALDNTRALARLAYDLEQERWVRVQAQAQWRRSPAAPVVDLQYIDRYPTVDAASWFARFMNLERIRLLRVAARHELPSRFGGEVSYLGSFVGGRSSSRLGLAALVPGGRIGYSLRLGDAGEENRVFGEYGYRLLPWLRLEAEAAVLSYTLLQDAPADQDRDVTTLAARARVGLRPGMRLLAEVQSLHNPDYDSDVRVIVGLDMSLARGNSRLGLDRGGWLR